MNRADSLSFWERESFFKDIDYLIVGSGIVGLSTALSLREKSAKSRILVVERGALPEGASTRNAGFACFGSITELLDDLKTNDESTVFGLVERRFRGLQRLRQRVGDDFLGYEPYGGYEVFKDTEGGTLENCLDSLAYFNKNVGSIVGKNDVYKAIDTNFGFHNTQKTLIWNTAEGQINTGSTIQRLLALARENNIVIYNGLKIKELHDSNTGVSVETEEGWTFDAQKVVVATNGFARRLMPDLAVLPARNQVLVTKPIQNWTVKGSFHYDKGYFYFRNIGNRLLLGGGRNLDIDGEMTDAFGHTDLIQNTLLDLAQKMIAPQHTVEVDMWWSGIMGVGAQKVPIMRFVSPNVLVAVRMGGMGVAIGTLVGEEAADMIV